MQPPKWQRRSLSLLLSGSVDAPEPLASNLSTREYMAIGIVQNWKCTICATHRNDLDADLVVRRSGVDGKPLDLVCKNCHAAVNLWVQ